MGSEYPADWRFKPGKPGCESRDGLQDHQPLTIRQFDCIAESCFNAIPSENGGQAIVLFREESARVSM